MNRFFEKEKHVNFGYILIYFISIFVKPEFSTETNTRYFIVHMVLYLHENNYTFKEKILRKTCTDHFLPILAIISG